MSSLWKSRKCVNSFGTKIARNTESLQLNRLKKLYSLVLFFFVFICCLYIILNCTLKSVSCERVFSLKCLERWHLSHVHFHIETLKLCYAKDVYDLFMLFHIDSKVSMNLISTPVPPYGPMVLASASIKPWHSNCFQLNFNFTQIQSKFS